MTPALSVCLATLNRGAFIGATLESIVSQAADDVEIVVVDGASSDQTPEVVASFAGRARINYQRLAAPGGVDRDYDLSVRCASGEYCWLMSDDDLLKPGALDAVREAARGRPSLVVVNAEVRNADLTRVLEESRLGLDGDRSYAPSERDHLLAATAAYLSFIGGVVIRRDVWLARDRERFMGSLFIHVGVIFAEPLPGAALVLARPLVVIRLGNAQWTARAFEIWMFKWPELVWSFASCTEAARAAVTPREPWRRLRGLFVQRARGAYSLAEYRRWIRPRLASPWRRGLARGAAVVPARVANALLAAFYWAFYRGPRRRLLLNALEGRYHFRTWARWRVPARAPGAGAAPPAKEGRHHHA
ncbi:MAG TPA: glycosyltransferase family 2 protein [Vicinamibacteria bacterium]